MRLTDSQWGALRVGSGSRWLGARHVGTMGSTMVALERRGLAEVRIATRRGRVLPFGEGDTRGNVMVYRLTPAGVEMQRKLRPLSEWMADELTAGYIDGTISREELDSEMDRRKPVQLTIYHWPTGHLSAIVKAVA